ncbi:hypothetical protein [Frigidibacter oleivorans]|uniref:hypothetical protein n=1 Tax=Frigidibacter oleivorans TaxID=2487129 RepID=UPI0013DFB92D|nr:hypothetical protein [Frigidibacter oleivorans]
MNDQPPTLGGSLVASFDTAAKPIITVDVQKYQAYLDDPELSDAQKEEFLQALWSIVVAFVELGFGVHPLQEVCGQNDDEVFTSAKEAFDQVESDPSDKLER